MAESWKTRLSLEPAGMKKDYSDWVASVRLSSIEFQGRLFLIQIQCEAVADPALPASPRELLFRGEEE